MKKLLLTVAMVVTLMLCLAVCASAVTYQTEDGQEIFTCVKDGGAISSYSGAFPKTDSEGNALVWYVVSKNGDTITVKSFKALGETGDINGTIDANGKYSITGIAGKEIVSINLPDNSGIKLINIDFNGGYTGSFPRDSQILFAYLPNTLEETTANGGGGWTVQRLFQYTPILECYFSDLDTTNPNHMKTIGNFDFYGCRNMRVCQLPYGITTIYGNTDHNNGPAFRECWRLNEITIPNSVTYIGPRAFESSGLVTIRLGANASLKGSKQALQTNSLRYVYLSDNEISGEYIFNAGAKDMVFFYTGTDYEGLKSTLSKNNAKLTGATPILWDSTKSDQYYKDLATSENKCYLVYGYSTCMAFYDGHSWRGENSIICNDFFGQITIGDTCAVCEAMETKESLAPIFTWKGYSVSTYGTDLSMVQCYSINRQSLDAYLDVCADFEYGFVATVNKTDGAISPDLLAEDVIAETLTTNCNDYVDIKVTGVPADRGDTLVVFCLYVRVGDNVYFLDNNTTSQSILGQSYNGILN